MSVLPPSPFAHGRVSGVAWVLSVGIHAAAVGAWWLSTHPSEPPASMGQRKGALQVRLQSRPAPPHTQADSLPPRVRPLPAPITVAGPGPTQPRPLARPKPAVVSTPLAASAPIPSASAVEPASATTVAAASVASAPSPPGATFANLFAPFINRPMGRGRWSSAPAPAPPPPDPEVQRQQAVQARRDQWNQAVQRLQDQLRQTPLADTCEVQAYLSQTGGDVSCRHADDQRLIHAMLATFITAPLVPAVQPEVCLHLHEHTIDWLPCPTGPPKAY